MAVSNIGYQPIIKLETPADFKLLNDELRAIWALLLQEKPTYASKTTAAAANQTQGSDET